ncbi:LpxI family protein [Acidaminococcus sp.]|uniref:LpxI family protein n=1 Tax=Acidaminococcus sp. TaxID=1872103 RepID=UPI003D7D9239
MGKTLGVLAGVGHLPVDVVRGAKKEGYRTVAIGLVPGTHEELSGEADAFYAINIGKVGKIFKTLQKEGVDEVTMIGKVTKEILYSGGILVPDWQAIKILMSLPDRHDDTIMNALVAKLESLGIHVMDQTLFLKDLMPREGVLSKRKPTKEEWEDMQYGFAMAKKIGGLDIGQTVVVKNKAIMAVEAIEGTDACILRGGKLGRKAIVAKTAKPAQDNRFDMPGVGVRTIESMIESGCAGIVMEAGRTLLVEREKALKLADEHNITVAAMKDPEAKP